MACPSALFSHFSTMHAVFCGGVGLGSAVVVFLGSGLCHVAWFPWCFGSPESSLPIGSAVLSALPGVDVRIRLALLGRAAYGAICFITGFCVMVGGAI